MERMHKIFTDREIARWIFLHPNLETELKAVQGKKE